VSVEGAGLEQVRGRVLEGLMASPRWSSIHSPEHSVQPDQPDQVPWTEKKTGGDRRVETDRWRQTGGDRQVETDGWRQTGGDRRVETDRWTISVELLFFS